MLYRYPTELGYSLDWIVDPPRRHQISELERQLREHDAGLQSPGGSGKKALSPQLIEISEFLQFEILRYEFGFEMGEHIETRHCAKGLKLIKDFLIAFLCIL